MIQLSPHFALNEFTDSATAAERGIDNAPDSNALANLKSLAWILEQVREVLGHPIKITSGYRSAALNAAVGGQKMSAHQDGLAADIVCPEYGSPPEVCRAIERSGILFDQVISEHGGREGQVHWCHFAVGYRGIGGRRECLTIDKNGTRMGLEG